MNPNSSVKVHFECDRGHAPHELCVAVNQAVPPNLRCEAGQPSGISKGGGSGCRIPDNLQELVTRELRDNMQESRRQGYVLIRD
ncbi:hypothetical protein [Leifsonella bigeumensis]|uniref:hypothetical protein n=1 Tax=Leifsonella bigeumensis TaxID=433643 RepID=UPI0031E0B2FC